MRYFRPLKKIDRQFREQCSTFGPVDKMSDMSNTQPQLSNIPLLSGTNLVIYRFSRVSA
jgi:hypothetical protein